jgi:hypothetical protein
MLVLGLTLTVVEHGRAIAVVVDANWWSNSTSSAGVWDPPGPNGPERVRLVAGATTGFIEGTVSLPSNLTWTLSAPIGTDGQFNLPTEYVDFYINNVFQQRFFNTPLSTLYTFTHVFTGNQFTYRMEMSSPSTNGGAHLIVGRGTVTSVPESSLGIVVLAASSLALASSRRALPRAAAVS